MYKEIKQCRDKYHKDIDRMNKIPLNKNVKISKKEKEKQFEINTIIKDKKNKYNFYNNLLKAFNKNN